MPIQGVITGYSIYVNGRYWETYESLYAAEREASRYRPSNNVDVLPMWKFTEEGDDNANRAA